MQGMVGNPTDHKYKYMASNKLLPDCPITTHAITNANYFFETDLSGVRGKTARKNQVGWTRKNMRRFQNIFTNCTRLGRSQMMLCLSMEIIL